MALTGRVSAEAGTHLLTSLRDLINVALKGEVPEFATSTFYEANLCALTKRDGGIRPIAVGCTYRRLVPKVEARPLSALGGGWGGGSSAVSNWGSLQKAKGGCEQPCTQQDDSCMNHGEGGSSLRLTCETHSTV